MRTLNSLLAPSLFIVVAGIAFSFYSVTYYPDVHLLPPFPIQDIVIRPIVIYPERAFGVSLIVAGSIFVALILTTQTALSHFNRHRSKAFRRTLPIGLCFSACASLRGNPGFSVRTRAKDKRGDLSIALRGLMLCCTVEHFPS
jgi:hypothetical protein